MKTYIAAAALFAAGTICANALGEADGSFFGEFYAENADFEVYGDTDLDEIRGKEWVSGCVGFSFTLENVVGGPFDDPVSDPFSPWAQSRSRTADLPGAAKSISTCMRLRRRARKLSSDSLRSSPRKSRVRASSLSKA